MRKQILTLLFFIAYCLSAMGQSTTIVGTIRSSKDSSVISGASIMVKGTRKGTVTNTAGVFSISCSPGSTLIISYLGFNPKEIVSSELAAKTIIYLTPANANQLNEVVVTTALGIKKEQKSLGYAVQTVNGDVMSKAKEPTAMGSLVGKVAGLDIKNTTDLFQNPGISLRGATPLIVIDGIPDPSADPYKINPDDIQSITVLKGTAAGALYGSIGINGAILYTTKKGHKGKLQVEANSSNLFQTGFTRIPQVQTEYGDGNLGTYAYVDGSGGGTEGGGWIWGPKLNQKDASTASGYWETTQYNSPTDPTTGELEPLPWIARGKNNLKNFFQTGMLSSNSVSATIGNDKGSFRVSASDMYQKGIDPNTSLNNINFSVGGNYALTSKLSINTKLTFNRQFSNNYPTTGYGQANVLYNLILWYNTTKVQAGELSQINKRYAYDATNEPAVLMSYSEQEFLLAEAIERGWISGNASTYYMNAIQASLEFSNYDNTYTSGDIQNYLNQSSVVLQSSTAIQQIITQKYISMFMNSGWLPFYEQRRTGFPTFTVNGGGVINEVDGEPAIPLRWMYPTDEYQNNATNVNAAVENQYGGDDDINGKMWLIQ